MDKKYVAYAGSYTYFDIKKPVGNYGALLIPHFPASSFLYIKVYKNS